MDSFVNQSSFSCDMKIIRAKNVQPLKSSQQLFVRCYLSTTPNNKIRLETQEISPKSDLFWNKSFCLTCLGSQESIAMLMHGSVVLELRSRNTGTFLRKIGSSKLLGIVEIPWKSVVESPNMEIVKWAVIKSPKNSKYSSRVMNDEDDNPTTMEIEMKVRVPKLMADQTIARKTRWNGECRCMDCACNNPTCFDFEFFALGSAL